MKYSAPFFSKHVNEVRWGIAFITSERSPVHIFSFQHCAAL